MQLLNGRKEKIFQALKKALTPEPVLKHPDMSKPFVLDPDSSQYVVGAVLQQEFLDPDGKYRLHPIAYEAVNQRSNGNGIIRLRNAKS